MLAIIPSRHRSLTLLAAVLVAQILLLAIQIKQRDVRLIRRWAVLVVTPFQKAGIWTVDKVSGAWGGYVDLRHTREENARLRAELADLKLRANQLESRAAEADRLTTLLNFREAHGEAEMLVARVIGASAVGASKVVYLNRGEKDGVRKNMGVITPEGVVGKILEAYPEESQVLLLTDKESGVGTILAGARTLGVVRGVGAPMLLMDYVASEETIEPGQRILTSGQDRIFPRDLPVGTVVETRPAGSKESFSSLKCQSVAADAQARERRPFKAICVEPAARIDRLEEVIVLLTRQELAPKQEAEAAAKR